LQEEIVKQKSLRELNASIDNIDIQIKAPQNYNRDNTNKEYPLQLLKLFVILRRLGNTDAEIIEIVTKNIYHHESLKDYIIPFIFLKENLNLCVVSFGEKNNGGYLVEYDFSEFNEDKLFKYKKQLISSYSLNRTFPTFKEIIGFMLTLVGY
ncbi:MAG: hypothetical protein K2K76_08260, partial [Muribaculaceae bacterium]|nr:hypothetical protein [Muribaculaceae bacterium]